jgi:CBS domain containing-hemolysin-like protein
MYSGLNLAVFSLSRLRLESAAEGGDANARRVLAGIAAFLFATVVITLAAEIMTVQSETPGDDVIDEDLILVWAESGRRMITGSDLLGQ